MSWNTYRYLFEPMTHKEQRFIKFLMPKRSLGWMISLRLFTLEKV